MAELISRQLSASEAACLRALSDVFLKTAGVDDSEEKPVAAPAVGGSEAETSSHCRDTPDNKLSSCSLDETIGLHVVHHREDTNIYRT